MEFTGMSKVIRLTRKGQRLLDLGFCKKSETYRRFSVCTVLRDGLDDLLDSPQSRPRREAQDRNWNTGRFRDERYERNDFDSRRSGSWGRWSKPGRSRDWSSVQVVKNLYLEHEAVKEIPQEQVEEFLVKNNAKTYGHIPNPVLELDHINFPDEIKQSLFKSGIQRPTPIQSLMWPIALSGLDSVGIAQTGSGKTLGYMLPAIVHAINQESYGKGFKRQARALVVAPTRELSQQISSNAFPFCKPYNMRTVCLYGGSSKHKQMESIAMGQDIIVATPGRLIDVLRDHDDLLHHVSYLVIDEADRMLDMGFEPQLNKIMHYLNPDRQTTMWSATWPIEVRNLAANYMNNNVHVQIGRSQLTVNDDIEQKVVVVEDEMDKLHKFVDVMKPVVDDPQSKVLIFTNTKDKASRLAFKLKRALGKPIDAIHGNVEQRGRERLMRDFKDGRMPILVATDVAARGIDVGDITHVVNFDFPRDIEDYIHRVGRTGRAGRKGTSISFFCPTETPKLGRKLLKMLRQHNQDVPKELEVFDSLGTSKMYENVSDGREKYRKRLQYNRRELL